MENLSRVLEAFKVQELKMTRGAKGTTIHQTQRNALKSDLIDAFIEDLSVALNADVMRTSDGIGVVIDNEVEGGIPFVIDIAMKSLEYDVYEQNEAYIANEALKAAKAEERAKAKAIKYKNDTEARVLRDK